MSVYLHKDFCWPYWQDIWFSLGTLRELGVSMTSESLSATTPARLHPLGSGHYPAEWGGGWGSALEITRREWESLLAAGLSPLTCSELQRMGFDSSIQSTSAS